MTQYHAPSSWTKSWLGLLLLKGAWLLACTDAVWSQESIREAVVKIHTTRRPPDFLRPWSKSAPQEISGTGVVIDGNRILTNAHVVLYASSVHVQAHQSSQRKKAEVIAVSPEMDLAVISVTDTSFYTDRPTLELATEIPKLKDVVSAYGYPIGGEQLSITEGIVSRIESVPYAMEGFGLRIQVDAALNPGNSGGPAIGNGKILGLVFSGMRNADNIGYLIPAEEVQTFLDDVADGQYDGKVRLFGQFQTVENEALRQRLNLSENQGGMMVTEPVESGDDYPLNEFDVITRVGKYELDRQGNIQIQDDLKLTFHYAIPRVAQDGMVSLAVLRDGQMIEVQVPVTARRDLIIKPLRGAYPEYFVYGPMVFTAASQDLVAALQRGPGRAMLGVRENPLVTRMFESPTVEGEEVVVLGPRLFPHRITEGYDPQFFAVVRDINGQSVKNLRNLVEILRGVDTEFIEVRLDGNYETLIFRRDEVEATLEEILEAEGIRSQYSAALAEVWEPK